MKDSRGNEEQWEYKGDMDEEGKACGQGDAKSGEESYSGFWMSD